MNHFAPAHNRGPMAAAASTALRRLLVATALLVPLAYAPAALAADCVSGTAYPYTGLVDGSGTQTTANCTVPAGVTSMSVVVIGGGGGGGTGANAGAGGSGAKVTVTNFPVTAGATLHMRLGGPGIGGQANSSSGGGRGGHYSSIFTTNTTTLSTIATGGGIVAGGGGGGGMGHTASGNTATGGNGGSAGGTNGAGGNGSTGSINVSGTVYTQTGGAGGANGTGGTGGTGVTNGDNGDASNGGLSGLGDKGGRGGSGYGGGGGGGSGGAGGYFSGGGGGGGGSIGPSTGGASTTYESANNGGAAAPVTNGAVSGGNGSVTLTFTIPKTAQTITFTSTAPTGDNARVGGPTYTPTATSTSNLAVAITLDASTTNNACTLTTGVVTFTGNGTCVINANQAGDNTFAAAPQVQQSITVGSGSQTITNFASTATSLLTSQTATLSATKGAGTANVVFSSKTTAICTVVNATVTALAEGTCTVAANQAADTNYNAAPEVTLNITISTTQSATAAPGKLIVSPGSGQVTASFLAPNGNTITNYEYSTDGGTTWSAFNPAVTTSPVSITATSGANPVALVNGTAYSIKLRAVDGATTRGQPSDAVSVTPGTDGDTDSVSTSIEDAVPGANGGTGDGNGDGTPDSAQNSVASLPGSDGTTYLTVASASGKVLSKVVPAATPSDLTPTAGSILSGVALTINGVANGGTETVDLYLPSSGITYTGVMKKNRNTGNYDTLPTTITMVGSKTKISFSLVDGGPYDADGLANGAISDPAFVVGGPAAGASGGGGGAMGLPVLFVLGGLALMGVALRRNQHLG